jgi:alanyl-tRNA synthetase
VIASAELRRSFLDFFNKNGHRVISSSPVAPLDDPSLLFTNAGMNQFKNYFLGLEKPKYRRTCSVQKCIRASGKHNDLEDVGRDGRHHTFFEMLGNWSFGDYYKREAIEWAWEFVTGILSLPPESLWVSIYKDDDDAYELWLNGIGIGKERIIRLGDIENGDEENFWSMGETGPCGPCSEILYDYLPDKKKTYEEGIECGDISELWNLVFMEFNRLPDGSLEPLPEKHIDTGMGLERTLAVLQGVRSNYETDLFIPLIQTTEEISDMPFEERPVSYRVISDHIRSLAFAIADGVVPSNEGRGYVLRRILRRALRHGKLLNIDEPFLHNLVEPLVNVMGSQYGELIERKEHVKNIIRNEEELFYRTLDRGLFEFEKTVERLKRSETKVFPGKEAFILHDTYGFPYDLTELMASEKGMSVSRPDFEKEMELQRERAKSDSKFKKEYDQGTWEVLREADRTEFTGYERMSLEGMKLVKYRVENNRELLLVFDRTPFYGEAGGQVGDTGYIKAEGIRIRINDVKRVGDLYIHSGVMEQGEIKDTTYCGEVDQSRRRRIMANHTATHLLHHALKEVIGSHATQAGSLVAPERLRFDFNHYNPLTDAELESIEERVNSEIFNNSPVHIYNDIPLQEARSMGAVALFGEKYGERVRVVRVDEVSTELCGGTHAACTGDIGLFKIVKEGSVSSGIRRIEAITGMEAYNYIRKYERILNKVSGLLRASPDGSIEQLTKLMTRVDELESQLKKKKKKDIVSLFDTERDTVQAGKFSVLFIKLENYSIDEMRGISDTVRSKLKMGVIFIASLSRNRITCILSATEDAVKGGVHSGNLLKEIAPIFGGSAGGKPHLGQGGGTKPAGIDEAFEKLRTLVSKM